MENQLPIYTPSHQPKRGLQFLLIGVIMVSFFITFFAGYYLNSLFMEETSTTAIPKPTISVQPVPSSPKISEVDQTEVMPVTQSSKGASFFEDSVLFIAESEPHVAVFASVNRLQQKTSYSQNSRVSYFDGVNWTRKSDSTKTSSGQVSSDSLIHSWTETINTNRVLKEGISGALTIGSTQITFDTKTVSNEIGMRSLPFYTKFMSNGKGTFSINGKFYSAHVLVVRIYSMDSSEIQFYNDPFGVTTDWLVFWDTMGNFYHIDMTDVTNPTTKYQPHTIGVLEDIHGSVNKTFLIDVTRDSAVPPKQYTFSMQDPINTTLSLELINSVNKVPSGTFEWYLGEVTGTVTKSDGESMNGIGIIEYIHK